ncbi:alanine racemase [Acinetobacter shaoyimingii]|uniref:Alanine racemase n=1 Tax=Acinetobacter shaoyimingii TaxID=2715164 RepID=A0A6G8RT25_9GAMM|nr:alanine racemase [Acinetobacter shaoyimingii]NHB56446.1 alanine racemase [Acinetobacter shaoyimingii]QIO05051.1 alanine racemase [Acinetobacter shaoyimingii]
MNDFFQQLNRDLKQQGTGTPQLIIDSSRLDQNIAYVQQQLKTAPHLQARLVVKSLACMSLLKKLSCDFNCRRFMVFHIAHLSQMFEAFDQSDLLFGKPMPIKAVEQFYQQIYQQHIEIKNNQLHWLIDHIERLKQYVELAKTIDVKLRVNIEIDVGLHRGGVRTISEFDQLLNYIRQHSDLLELTGLMGYDAHVTKVPSIIKKTERAYEESQQIYADYIDHLKTHHADLWHDQLCFNGGGSPTFEFHVKDSVCNDLSFGSMLFKPSDFDSQYLKNLQPCLFIAAPVLKVLDAVEMPSMPWLNPFKGLHHQQAVFIYGGYWMGQYVYPPKTRPHLLYGRSTNQELVCISRDYPIHRDDYVFVRPSQSESVIPQFSHSYLYQHQSSEVELSQCTFQVWENFRE